MPYYSLIVNKGATMTIMFTVRAASYDHVFRYLAANWGRLGLAAQFSMPASEATAHRIEEMFDQLSPSYAIVEADTFIQAPSDDEESDDEGATDEEGEDDGATDEENEEF